MLESALPANWYRNGGNLAGNAKPQLGVAADYSPSWGSAFPGAGTAPGRRTFC
jgi:hypothetical protein